jgi:hypothetical protein
MTRALPAMNDHPGHALPRAARLTGVSAERWERTAAGVVELWEWFDAYRDTLDRHGDVTVPAEAVWARLAEVTAVLDAARDAWTRRAALPDPVAAGLAGLPGREADGLRAEAAAARASADPPTPDPALEALARRAAQVVAMHEAFPSRVAAVAAEVAETGAVPREASVVRARVAARTVGDHPRVPEAPAAGRAWAALRRRFPDVRERDVAEVGSAAARGPERAVPARLAGSLERRAELRGRLEAYRAEATARGHAEDAGLSALHRDAWRVLHSAPCDLREGTPAVARYQRAVLDRTEAAR